LIRLRPLPCIAIGRDLIKEGALLVILGTNSWGLAWINVQSLKLGDGLFVSLGVLLGITFLLLFPSSSRQCGDHRVLVESLVGLLEVKLTRRDHASLWL